MKDIYTRREIESAVFRAVPKRGLRPGSIGEETLKFNIDACITWAIHQAVKNSQPVTRTTSAPERLRTVFTLDETVNILNELHTIAASPRFPNPDLARFSRVNERVIIQAEQNLRTIV